MIHDWLFTKNYFQHIVFMMLLTLTMTKYSLLAIDSLLYLVLGFFATTLFEVKIANSPDNDDDENE